MAEWRPLELLYQVAHFLVAEWHPLELLYWLAHSEHCLVAEPRTQTEIVINVSFVSFDHVWAEYYPIALTLDWSNPSTTLTQTECN